MSALLCYVLLFRNALPSNKFLLSLNALVHLDDLARNFALNPGSGLKCTAYYRNKKQKKGVTDGRGQSDRELLGWGRFLELLATELPPYQTFDDVDFQYWRDYVSGSKSFLSKK